MSTEILLDIAVAAVGIALSPFPVIAITLVLGSENALIKGLTFAVGWLIGLGALVGLSFWLLVNLDSLGNQPDQSTNWVRLVFGSMLLLLAVKKWFSRSRPSEREAVPGWIKTVDTLSPSKTLALGVTLGGINPKNLAFSILFITDLLGAGFPIWSSIVYILLFLLMSSLVILGSVGYYLLAPTSAAKRLLQIKTFMIVQNDTIMMLMFFIFGLLLIGKSL